MKHCLEHCLDEKEVVRMSEKQNHIAVGVRKSTVEVLFFKLFHTDIGGDTLYTMVVR